MQGPSDTDAICTSTVPLLAGGAVTVGLWSTETRIACICGAQNGSASRRQLRLAGVRESAIDRRLRNGRLLRRHPGVYIHAPLLEVPLLEETAALLACEPALLCGHSACTLWELRVGIARPVHVLIAHRRRAPKLDGVVVHRSAGITAGDMRVHRGLPVTSPAWTALDAAGELPDDELERVIAEGYYRRLFGAAELHDVLDRAGGHPGAGTLRRVLGRGEPARSESRGERELAALLRRARLPRFQTQVPMLGYRIDFLWPELRLAVELDDYPTHGSRLAFERDRIKDARLKTEAGIDMLRVTRTRAKREPFAVIATVARAVGAAEALRAGRTSGSSGEPSRGS